MIAIILIFGLAGLVWAAFLARRISLPVCCAVYLPLACCCGAFFFQFECGGFTLSIDRLFLVFLLVMFAVQWRLGGVDWKPLLKVDCALLAFLALLMLSALLHDWRDQGPGDVPVLQHLMNGYLIPFMLYWIARQSAITESNATSLLVMLSGFGIYLAVTGLMEVSGTWSLVFPRYIADPEVGLHFGRARGPMVHSVTYGLYLATALLCLWLWRERWTRWAHGSQLLVLLLGLLLVAAVYFSKTRSAWLGAATGLMIVLGLTLRGRWRRGVLLSMVAAGVLVCALKMDDILALQREGTVQDTRKSASMRGSFAFVSWQMVRDRPLFGFGFGQFAKAKLPYLADRTTSLHLEAIRDYVHHNTFLSVLTETGLVGLGLLLAVLFGWLRAGVSLVRDERVPPWVRRHGVLLLGLLGVIFWQMMGHEITFTPLDQSLLFLVAGLAVGLQAAWRRDMAVHRKVRPVNWEVAFERRTAVLRT